MYLSADTHVSLATARPMRAVVGSLTTKPCADDPPPHRGGGALAAAFQKPISRTRALVSAVHVR